MNEKYNVYLCRTHCETLDRIFLSLKSQLENFEHEKEFAFIRTEQQIDKSLKNATKYQIH